MTENILSETGSRLRIVVILLLALAGALMAQIIHEFTHAAFMWLVGTGVEIVQLFAVRGRPVTDPNALLVIYGSAAIVNIILGLLAVLFFHRPGAPGAAVGRLLLMYIAAYMLMAGFGYLFIDALFYNPTAEFHPDWQNVIHLLGGGWEVRLPILVIGTVGLLGVFFWLPNAALRFVPNPTEKRARVRGMLWLTLVPYIVINLLLTLLSFSHPLGAQGVVLSLFAYWCGYIALFWAFFIGGLWTDVKKPYTDATVLALPTVPLWLIGVAGMWAILAFFMLPGIQFV